MVVLGLTVGFTVAISSLPHVPDTFLLTSEKKYEIPISIEEERGSLSLSLSRGGTRVFGANTAMCTDDADFHPIIH